MRFYADLHVHSKYSRATSGDCDLFHLSYWAQRKGIAVIGTGDFTHPAWMAELRENLVPAEPGLFRLRDDLERAVDERLAGACRGAARFMLSVEISTIYKKGERTRKIHHLVYVPGFDAADRLVRALSRIGNLNSDGRPILGLDSRHLLEAVLESGEGSYLVPAHIWTPWFSVLGSKAGFDAVDECYGDLAPHIFALETGLSSDPAMNWRISALDRYRLVSSSDAHSPAKLGREATAYDTPLDYFAIRRALETGEGFGGTVEFFPEEGKYHLDGHRKCNVVLSPDETRARNLVCPVCGQAVTVGVLHRVEELADRAEGARPDAASDYKNLVPLPEVLSELHGAGPTSKGVQRSYERLLSSLGPELFILGQAPLEDVARAGAPLLAEAISRMREGKVIREAGYDGEYGVIRLFQPTELRSRLNGGLLFGGASAARGEGEGESETRDPAPAAAPAGLARGGRGKPKPRPEDAARSLFEGAAAPATPPPEPVTPRPATPTPTPTPLGGLDPEQRQAAEIARGALLILAGPGTGKTRTLTHRIAHLVVDHGVPPEQCLAITFTRRAADELRERLARLLGDAGERVPAMTFHALGLSLLREHALDGCAPVIASERERAALLSGALGVSDRKALKLLAEISKLKRAHGRRVAALQDEVPPPRIADSPSAAGPPLALDRAWEVYERELAARGQLDFDDLVGRAVELLEERPDVLSAARAHYGFVSIDEYQDVDEMQYRLVRALVPADGDVCAIGDPDQAIYGFRGADVGFFFRFQADYPSARLVRLKRNYRSTRVIVDAALSVIAPSPTLGARELSAMNGGDRRITVHEARTERGEAELVVHTIERLIGGSTFFSMDSGRVGSAEANGGYAFSDIAILTRTEAQTAPLVEALARSGMPYQRRSERRVVDRAAADALAAALAHTATERPLAARLKEAAARLREEVAQADPAPPAAEAVPAEGSEPAVDSVPEEETSTDTAEPRLREADVDAALELLLALAERCGGVVDRFLLDLSLTFDIDACDPRADRISLLTLHAAKGLEFRVVFLVGCEDGLLPLRFPGRQEETDADEERRLFYVGMTRARERLFLTHARERLWHGKVAQREVSPFVRELEERWIEQLQPEFQRRPAPAAAPERQLKLF